MQRTQAIGALRARTAALKARGATSLFLFGSTLRNEAGPESDIDLFIDYDPATGFSLLGLAAIKNLLEDELGLTVDVTTRDSLHPALRSDIERLAERVY